MKSRYKSRPRWLAERWVSARAEQLQQRWVALRQQLLPADWPTRCARMSRLRDAETTAWRPQPGSSNAELMLVLQEVSLRDRRWLGALLDAPSAGAATLVESVARLQLDWRAKLDPVRTHRQYAEQLATLAELLRLDSAAAAAYLENERKIVPRVDELLFESLPMRLRAKLINEAEPGSGAYIGWWQQRLLARCGEQDISLEGIGQHDWPEMPAAWLALGWIGGLRLTDSKRMAPGK